MAEMGQKPQKRLKKEEENLCSLLYELNRVHQKFLNKNECIFVVHKSQKKAVLRLFMKLTIEEIDNFENLS